jgi:hypothetical protein
MSPLTVCVQEKFIKVRNDFTETRQYTVIQKRGEQMRNITLSIFKDLKTVFPQKRSAAIEKGNYISAESMQRICSLISNLPEEALFSSGTFLDTRSNENFRSASLVTFDIDKGNMTIKEAKKRLAQYAHIIYVTKSHDIISNAFRVIVVLDKPVNNSLAFSFAVKELAKQLKIPTDKKTLDSAHIFFVPRDKKSIVSVNGGKAIKTPKFVPTVEQKREMEAKKAALSVRSPMSPVKFSFETMVSTPMGDKSMYRKSLKKTIYRMNLALVNKGNSPAAREAGYLVAEFNNSKAPGSIDGSNKGIFALCDGRFLVAYKNWEAEALRQALVKAGAVSVEAHIGKLGQIGFFQSELLAEVIDIVRFNEEVTNPSEIVSTNKVTDIKFKTKRALRAYRKGEIVNLKIEIKTEEVMDQVNDMLRSEYAPSKDGYRKLFARVAMCIAKGRSEKSINRNWLAIQCETSVDIVDRVIRVLENNKVIERTAEHIPCVKSKTYNVSELKKLFNIAEMTVVDGKPEDGKYNDWVFFYIIKRCGSLNAAQILEKMMNEFGDFIKAKEDRYPLAEYLAYKHAKAA